MELERQQRLFLSLFALGAAAMLVGALGDREYSYYILLRAAVCVAAVLVCVLAFRWRQLWAVGIFAPIAVLFNPVAPINLSEGLWRLIDVGAAGLFVLAAATVEPPGEGTVRRLSRLPSRLLGKNIPSGVVIVMATALVLVPLGVVAYRMDLVGLYRLEAARWEWRQDLADYNSIPVKDAEAKAKGIVTRERYLSAAWNAEVDAKLFITGQITSLHSWDAAYAADSLRRKLKIDVNAIKGVQERRKYHEDKERWGQPHNYNTFVDRFIEWATPLRSAPTGAPSRPLPYGWTP